MWNDAPNAIKAPNNDLQLLKNLIKYKQIHPKAALEKLCNHFWYLHEQLAGLTHLDSTVAREEKLQIEHHMKRKNTIMTNDDNKQIINIVVDRRRLNQYHYPTNRMAVVTVRK
ncbi:hypothetical protein PV326_009371 [Microctonus aethiopoides]|nr:hypothetical protein PV326_009371 [Microctonus aethiopoides]